MTRLGLSHAPESMWWNPAPVPLLPGQSLHWCLCTTTALISLPSSDKV